jgi:DNA repair protein RadC
MFACGPTPVSPSPRQPSCRHCRRAALRRVRPFFRSRASDILAHVHPSGVAEPSKADEYITDRVKQALALVDIKVLDHIIVAGGETMSFAERGMM